MSRGQAFEDWLTAMVCALAAETKEAEYLAMVERHKTGKPGKRGVDLLGEMFAELLLAMEKNDGDVLGDLFEGSISYGENGLFLTPEGVRLCIASDSWYRVGSLEISKSASALRRQFVTVPFGPRKEPGCKPGAAVKRESARVRCRFFGLRKEPLRY